MVKCVGIQRGENLTAASFNHYWGLMISIDASRACRFCMTCVNLTLTWVVALQADIVQWS